MIRTLSVSAGDPRIRSVYVSQGIGHIGEFYGIQAWENARLFAAAPQMLEALRRMDLTCTTDSLNPCSLREDGDWNGKHWGGGEACPSCIAVYALAKALDRGA